MEIPRHWRLKTQRYRLEGSTCPICGRPTFPPRPVCAMRHGAAQPVRIAGYGLFELPALDRTFDAISLKGLKG
jgi:uncharacterized OB-fold protein